MREATKERASRWNRENRDKRLVIEHRMRAKNPVKYMLKSSKSNAKKRGLAHTITLSDIQMPDVCPVFNTPFVFDTPYAPSLDRIDNSQGYVPGNLQVISRKANYMKNDATPAELRAFAEWVLRAR